jgi:menaquinone-dependent protoporphyrinogen oxidase
MRAIVLFATREGQTARIAERIAADLRGWQIDVDVYDVRTHASAPDWTRYSTAWVAASVHVGHHERELIEFVRRHRRELDRLDGVFVSVTLSEAGAEDPRATADKRARSAGDATRMIETFVEETGWRPSRSLPVAGALAYTRYNFLVRFVMKRIARAQGGPTDTSRDHDLTNWSRLDQFVDGIVRSQTSSVV